MDPYYIGNDDSILDNLIPDHAHDHGVIGASGSIIESFTHHPMPHNDVAYQAAALGLGGSDGISDLHHAGQILTANGVPNQHVEQANIDRLLTELRADRQVMLNLPDAHLHDGSATGGLFADLTQKLGLGSQRHLAGHTIAVQGIDESNAAHPQVILHNPSHPGNAPISLPLDEFSAGFRDDGFPMLVADTSAHTEPAHHGHHPYVGAAAEFVTQAVANSMGVSDGIGSALGQVARAITEEAWDKILPSI